MRNGILYGAYHFAVAVEAYDVCDVVVFVKEKVHAHNHHRVERFGWGGELGVFGKLLIEVVFEFFQSKGQEVVFVLEVSVERGSVDHRFVAKVDDADLFDGFFFHHIEQRIAQEFARAHDSQIFFLCRHSAP